MNHVVRVRTLPRAPFPEHWTAESVLPQLRAEHWTRGVESASGGALRPQGGAAGRRIVGAITSQRLPDVHLAHLRGTGQRLACQPESRCPLLVLVEAGDEWMVQAGGREHAVRPGQVAIIRVGSGAVLHFRHGIDAALLAGSAAWAQRWAVAADGDAAVRLCDADSGWGKILATMLRELAVQPQAAAGESGTRVGELLGFAAAAAGRTEAAPRFAVNLVDEARRICVERLGDSELRAATLARGLGVSVRTLVRAYQDAGTTFSECLRELRLQQAALLLSQPELAHLGVAEVGQRCGYPSAPHFVREFRRRWGSTPGQARADSATRQAASDVLSRMDQVLTQTRERIDRQKARVTRMTASQALHLPAALDLLRNLEQSLAALERLRDTADCAGEAGHRAAPRQAR